MVSLVRVQEKLNAAQINSKNRNQCKKDLESARAALATTDLRFDSLKRLIFQALAEISVKNHVGYITAAIAELQQLKQHLEKLKEKGILEDFLLEPLKEEKLEQIEEESEVETTLSGSVSSIGSPMSTGSQMSADSEYLSGEQPTDASNFEDCFTRGDGDEIHELPGNLLKPF